jgi:hypothetical protein
LPGVATASLIFAFTACVCCEDFEPPQANEPVPKWDDATALLWDSQVQMRTSTPVKETAFPTHLAKQTAKDLGSDWEWGTG